jgi:transcriptional regulator with XRE-family HTH domain
MQKTVVSREYRVFLDLLRETRLNAGVTQIDLAERLDETQSFVSKCERGERRLDLVEVRRWCQSLQYPFPEFIRTMEAKLQGLGSNGTKRKRKS